MKYLMATTAMAATTLLSTAAFAAQCASDVLNKVMGRGKNVVGVKADYKAWGYYDSDGNLAGLKIGMDRGD